MKLKNIEHDLSCAGNSSFFVYNILEAETLNPNLFDLLESEILDKAFFYPKEDLDSSNNRIVDLLRQTENNIEVIQLYGSILKDKITRLDFIELDYNSYLRNIEDYISKLKNDYGYSYDFVKPLEDFFEISLNRISSENPEKRKFYMLNEDKIDASRLHETSIYDYFITVISTLENSSRIIVMNFGND